MTSGTEPPGPTTRQGQVSTRHNLQTQVANSNTAGYKRQVVEFETLLREEYQRDGKNLDGILPEVRTDHETPGSPDGNNVNLEMELNSLRENRLLYETYASILRNHFSLLQTAISGNV